MGVRVGGCCACAAVKDACAHSVSHGRQCSSRCVLRNQRSTFTKVGRKSRDCSRFFTKIDVASDESLAERALASCLMNENDDGNPPAGGDRACCGAFPFVTGTTQCDWSRALFLPAFARARRRGAKRTVGHCWQNMWLEKMQLLSKSWKSRQCVPWRKRLQNFRR